MLLDGHDDLLAPLHEEAEVRVADPVGEAWCLLTWVLDRQQVSRGRAVLRGERGEVEPVRLAGGGDGCLSDLAGGHSISFTSKLNMLIFCGFSTLTTTHTKPLTPVGSTITGIEAGWSPAISAPLFV